MASFLKFTRNYRNIINGSKVVIVNRDTGMWMRISKECFDILEEAVLKECGKEELLQSFQDAEDREYFEKLIDNAEGLGVLSDKEEDSKRLETVYLILTNRCNLKCKHCCVSAESISNTISNNEIDTIAFKKVIDKVTASNPDRIIVSGGEPMIRKDFMEIMQYLRHQYHGKMCSLAEIQKQTEYKDKLIRTIIVFENFYIAQEDSTNKIDFMSALRKVKEDNNYDITLTAEVTDTLHFDIMYDEEKYSKSDIEVVKDRFNALLEQLCSRAILLENDLELLSPQEKEVILGTFNDTKLNCKEMVFWDRFITVVENFSNNIALECCDEKITYQELYEKSCAVAANLIRIGVCKNDIVALEMNNSIETIIAILGIWRIGAGYVPIDPDYPVTRKDEIKSDCHSCITITNIADELLDGKVYINELMVEGMKSDYYETAPENIAYVLYTSGTTGKPKGIMVTQKNVCSYIESFNAEFSTNTETKILQQGTYTFDVFVEEVFPTLSTGGTVVVYPKKGGFDFEDLCNYMNDHNVTIISCSPLVLNEIIDIAAPIERVRYMIKNAGVRFVIQDAGISKIFAEEAVTLHLQEIVTYKGAIVHEKYEADIPAYVIYTSGSTGNPKGVVVNNRNIVNEIFWHIKEAELNENTIFVQNTAFIFDGSVIEIFSALLCGGRLRLVSDTDRKEPEMFLKRIKDANIYILPSMFRAVMDYAITNGLEKELNSYHRLGLVAEKIPEDLIERYLQIDGSNLKNVWNLYGPTETTITASFYYLNENMDYKHIPIGRPITNYNIFILNGNSLCGHGVVGEICISGVGVSEGYINNKEMTEKVFVDNPFGSGVMYRTGDTGYINENNEIVILGRIDEQVKIRGFRVELQEIEKQIMRLNGVDEAVVIRKKDSNGDFLAGYYTGTLRESDLRDAISGFLPTYMIPEYLIPIKSLPHLPNGKIDKKDLESRLIRHHRNSTKPITAAEKIICGIYEEVLEIDEVGRDDSFFELGGDSIKAIRIVSKLRNIGYQITVKSIMQLAKPVLIAKELQKMKMTDVEVQKATGEVLLSPIQYRFFEAKLENPDHFNQSVILTTNEQINLSAIKYSMKCILENHDQLRAVFDGKHQEIRDQFDEGQYALYLFNLKDSNLEDSLRKVGNELQKHISLSKKKLICCAVIESRDFHALMICIHHLVIDGISWSILIEDINELYAGYMRNKTVNIPKRTTSFKEWSETLSNYYQKGRNNEELLYWRKISKRLGNSKPLFSEVSISTLREVQFRLSEEITSKLVKLGQEIISMNPNEVLLTVLIRVLTILFNRKDISILIESHGRPELCEQIDITRTVGWFTALYPVLFEKIGDDYFDDLLIIKERLRSIPNNGVGYDVARMNKLLDPDYHEPLITYNYFGNREAENGIDSYTLRPSNYEIGNNIDIRNHFGSPLSVNAEIIKGKYCVDISYPISMITEKEYLAFKNMFLEQAEKYVIALEARKERVTTPSDYYQNDISLQDWSIITRKLTMFDEKLEDIYCLTPLQEGMLYDKLRNVDSLNYVLQTVIKLRKPIDLSIMEDAIERLSEAHSILKTHIFYDGIAKPKQVVPITRKIGLEYIDLTDKQGKNDLFEDICNNQRNRGFDFERDSLIRFVVCRLSDKDNKIIITAHHVIMDGWSFPIIVNDLMKLYENRDLRLNRPRYAEYINYMKNKDNSCVYWKELLQGVEEKTAIIPLKKDISFENDILEVEMSICESDVKKIEKLARKYHVTTNTFVETVWGILLQQYNGIDDAIFGKVVSGRNIDIPEIEKMVGLFINTIPVRVKSERDIKFIDLLKRIQNQSVESSEHDHISLMKIQEEAGIGENSVQTVLAFENYYVDDASMDYGYEVENSKEQTDFDLALAVSQDKRLRFNLMYRVGKYSTIEMDYLLEHLKNLIQDVLSDPEKKVSELCVVSQQEKTDIMTLFNRPINDFSKDTVIDRFVKIVERFPEKIAVESEVDRLTYHELNQRSNYIAMKLIDLGVKQNDIVAILMERSCEMLVAIVSVLKAGAAYLPIAPNQPNDRIHYMLTDSEVKTVIVDHMRQNVTALDEQYIIDLSKQTDVMDNNIHLDIMPENLAYTIYTSGTTGKPKGVLIEHRNLINLVDWLAKELQLNEESKVIQNFAFIFDGSVWEIFPTILSGSCLRIVSDEEKMNPEKMISVFSGAHLTIIPSMYRELLNYAKKNGKLSQLHSLKTLLLGAEELPKDLVDDFFVTGRECKNIPRLINAYGPTETTVCCTYYELDKDGNHVPYIGKSINNTQAYIVQNGHLAGIGMVGEVCISGNGVARGYLKREELNREKFVYYPFKENVRMYRTGDLGRWNIDGNIELLGRIGEQVKIRGFRIELEEIAQTLRKYPKIEDAAVIYDKYESGKLIAYCVKGMLFAAFCVAQSKLDEENIKKELSNYIPQYMIPNNIYQLEEFPYTVGGKLDRHKLIEEYKSKVEDSGDDVVMAIFRKVLNVTKVLTSDDFFEMGGDSIKAIQIVSALRRKGYELKVREILEGRKIDKILERVKKKTVQIEYSQEEITGEFSLSPIQKVFFNVMRINNPNYFNQSYMLETDEVIDIDAVKYSLDGGF